MMTILTVITILADIGLGAAAYKLGKGALELARSVKEIQSGHDHKLTEHARVLLNHEERIKKLEAECSTPFYH